MQKIQEAREVIKSSLGSLGIAAGCDRYKEQFWTRDFALAGLDALLEMNLQEVAHKQILNIASRQNRSGSVPARITINRISFIKKFFDQELFKEKGYLFRKLVMSQTYLIKRNPLNIRRWFVWYSDIEILFIIVAKEYINDTKELAIEDSLNSNINKAFNFIEKKLMRNGLVVGSDWRDVVYSLSDKSVFCVNILLWRAYVLSGKDSKAEKLKDKIEEDFWNGRFYSDTPGDFTFDLLGHSMAVLWNFIPQKRYEEILKKFDEMKTPFGYKANDMLFPNELSEFQEHERTNQFSTVWPFIHGYAILALVHMKQYDLAKEQMNIWDSLDNFWEWYDPINGRGHGEKNQMWSASLYLQAADAIAKIEN